MNGWNLKKVFRVNGKLVVARDIKDAIAVYQLYTSPTQIEITEISQVYGNSRSPKEDAVCRDEVSDLLKDIADMRQAMDKFKHQLWKTNDITPEPLKKILILTTDDTLIGVWDEKQKTLKVNLTGGCYDMDFQKVEKWSYLEDLIYLVELMPTPEK